MLIGTVVHACSYLFLVWRLDWQRAAHRAAQLVFGKKIIQLHEVHVQLDPDALNSVPASMTGHAQSAQHHDVDSPVKQPESPMHGESSQLLGDGPPADGA